MISILLCCLSFLGCGDDGGSRSELRPALEITVESYKSTSATLGVKKVNATHVRILCEATGDTSAETAKTVAETGEKHTGTTITVEGLSPKTAYTVFAVACDDAGGHGSLQYVQFTTGDSATEMYPWEEERSGLLTFTDMVLCYGGSRHRTPFLWEKERFGPFVTYVDEEGAEHWLFDGFLLLEFVSASRPDGKQYSYCVGSNGTSAGRAQWEELLDYWFAKDNGVDALEQAVKAAAERMGGLPSKRKVIISMPDPIIYKEWTDMNESTAYWGQLDGRTMDFAKGEDRVAVYKWYINEVRKRFDKGNYQYVDLAGFYIISEELVSPDDGWNHELKKSDEVFPAISDYLHSVNQSLSWIPYNRSAGYKRWKLFKVDYAYMQPNYFWDNNGTKPLSRFFSDIADNDLAMEFEFDWELLEGQPNSDVYKERFRAYMAGAKSYGVYGTKLLSYYQGNNVLYDLMVSQHASDQALFHEFCQFVIGNPLRK